MKRESEFRHPLSKILVPLILDMCRYPDDCHITEYFSVDNLRLSIVPHRADFKVICGRSGRQIKALKYFAQCAGALQRVDADVLLEESLIGEPEAPRPFRQDPEFDVEALLASVNQAARCLFGREVKVECERQVDKLKLYLDEPEEISSVMALNDIFYPSSFRKGMICEIKCRKRLEPFPV